MVEENSNMLLGTGDKPTPLRWLLLAIQHVCAMFGATILVPIVVNTTAGADILSIPVALVSSGLGTLIYLICTRNRSPVYLGLLSLLLWLQVMRLGVLEVYLPH